MRLADGKMARFVASPNPGDYVLDMVAHNNSRRSRYFSDLSRRRSCISLAGLSGASGK